MGILDRLRWASDVMSPRAESAYTLPSWDGDTAQVANLPQEIAQAFGINVDSDRITRTQAMSIPAVRRGRQVIASTLGSAELVATRRIGDRDPERVSVPLLGQPDPTVSRSFTLTWTIDDLLFYGVSWWRVLSRGQDRKPLTAERVSPDRVTIDHSARRVLIDGRSVDDADVIRFDGPDEGILKHGARALKTSLLLEEAVRKYARMDIPLGFLLDEDGSMLEAEVQTFLDSWEAARQRRTTAYLPRGLKYENPTFNAEQLELGDARAFQSMEIARLLNLPASYVNAPTNDSLTYATTESNRRELVDLTLAAYIAPIEQRLSMPDVTVQGTTVAFDLGKFLRGDIKSVIDTGKTAVEAGLMTRNEVRVDWLGLPPIEGGDSLDTKTGQA